MKNYISINGKQTELTDEQLKQLGFTTELSKPEWADFGIVKGFYVDYDSGIESYDEVNSKESNKNVFPTEEEAEACLTLSQLCQWRDKYNEGWKPDWTKDSEYKWFIEFYDEKIITMNSLKARSVLAFKTTEIRDKFLEDFSELIKIAMPLL